MYMTMIDTKDFVLWNIKMIESRVTDIMNITSDIGKLTFKDFLETCKKIAKSDAEFIWMDDEFLEKYKVLDFTILLFYLSQKVKGMFQVNIEQVLKNGLTFRPLAETIKDIYSWIHDCGLDAKLKVGIDEKKEKSIINDFLNSKCE